MDSTKFTFTLADGAEITSVVQGCGGLLSRVGVLAAQIERARKGLALGIFEPSPGHARLFPRYDAVGDGKPLDLDLRGVSGVREDARS